MKEIPTKQFIIAIFVALIATDIIIGCLLCFVSLASIDIVVIAILLKIAFLINIFRGFEWAKNLLGVLLLAVSYEVTKSLIMEPLMQIVFIIPMVFIGALYGACGVCLLVSQRISSFTKTQKDVYLSRKYKNM